MPDGPGWAWWAGTLIGLVIGLVIKDAAAALGQRLLHRLTPGFTERESEAQKTGELEAIRKHLDTLVEQARQITAVQSLIQAEINGELWARQMVWQQKRETYFNILKLAHAFQNAMGRMSSALTVYQQNLHSNASRENLTVAWSQVKRASPNITKRSSLFWILSWKPRFL